MKPLSECRLYTFVDTAYLGGRDVGDVTRQLCDGGSDLIQLRAKTSSLAEVQRMAETILQITQAAGVHLVINDHPKVAQNLRPSLCHLGQEDFFDAGFTHVSQLSNGAGCPGPSIESISARTLRVGLSTHHPSQAARAIEAGVDYIAIGPVFPTPTKPTAKAVTTAYVRWAASHISLPWFAIGGITLDNVEEILVAGARRICVVSAILSAQHVTEACQTFRERIFSAPL